MICVVDASVAVKWFAHGDWATREDHIEPATALLLACRDGAVNFYQPPHFLADVAAVLARLTPQTATQNIEDLTAMSFTWAACSNWATTGAKAASAAQRLARSLQACIDA